MMKKLFEYYSDDQIEEQCGFILEDGEIVQLKNVSPEPTKNFEICPEDILLYVDRISTIWHTHPKASSVLSGSDKECMSQWPRVSHIIVGNDGIRKYEISEGAILNADYLPR